MQKTKMKGGENMKRYAFISAMLAVAIVSSFALVSAVQYGMMGDDGQFVPLNQGYGMMGNGAWGMMPMMMGYGSYGYGAALLSWITYLLTIALIVAAMYWLIKSANKR